MLTNLETWIWLAGWGHLSILAAATIVPFQLRWRETLGTLPRLHRQMYGVYASYVWYTIAAIGAVCLLCASDLAAGTTLARAVCAYVAFFWGVRLALQGFFDARPHLTHWWIKAGYHALTVLFTAFTIIFAIGALAS